MKVHSIVNMNDGLTYFRGSDLREYLTSRAEEHDKCGLPQVAKELRDLRAKLNEEECE